ncbi:MAG: hypothetical protein JWM28_2325 [Chitinophagaceae bacterium]|nr:hypothetical protein [Chitinophagaceae bacterium]
MVNDKVVILLNQSALKRISELKINLLTDYGPGYCFEMSGIPIKRRPL